MAVRRLRHMIQDNLPPSADALALVLPHVPGPDLLHTGLRFVARARPHPALLPCLHDLFKRLQEPEALRLLAAVRRRGAPVFAPSPALLRAIVTARPRNTNFRAYMAAIPAAPDAETLAHICLHAPGKALPWALTAWRGAGAPLPLMALGRLTARLAPDEASRCLRWAWHCAAQREAAVRTLWLSLWGGACPLALGFARPALAAGAAADLSLAAGAARDRPAAHAAPDAPGAGATRDNGAGPAMARAEARARAAPSPRNPTAAPTSGPAPDPSTPNPTPDPGPAPASTQAPLPARHAPSLGLGAGAEAPTPRIARGLRPGGPERRAAEPTHKPQLVQVALQVAEILRHVSLDAGGPALAQGVQVRARGRGRSSRRRQQ